MCRDSDGITLSISEVIVTRGGLLVGGADGDEEDMSKWRIRARRVEVLDRQGPREVEVLHTDGLGRLIGNRYGGVRWGGYRSV